MRTLRILLLASLSAGAAYAKGAPPAQTHHCKMPDGTVDMKKTHKQCTAAKGTWARDEPDAAKGAPDAAKGAPAPAAPPAAPAPAPPK